MGKFKDLSGKTFGDLLVLSRGKDYVSPKGYRGITWNCKCICGAVVNIRGCNIRSGASTSCGCKRINNPNRKTHGKKNTRLYKIWVSMKDRCLNENCVSYKDYGLRGISVCKEWRDGFDNFYNWSINNGYSDTLSIDRMDNNGDYCPENCRWSDNKTQANNTRHNHLLTYKGETKTMKQWSECTGIKYQKIKDRINKCGWSVERALSTY